MYVCPRNVQKDISSSCSGAGVGVLTAPAADAGRAVTAGVLAVVLAALAAALVAALAALAAALAALASSFALSAMALAAALAALASSFATGAAASGRARTAGTSTLTPVIISSTLFTMMMGLIGGVAGGVDAGDFFLEEANDIAFLYVGALPVSAKTYAPASVLVDAEITTPFGVLCADQPFAFMSVNVSCTVTFQAATDAEMVRLGALGSFGTLVFLEAALASDFCCFRRAIVCFSRRDRLDRISLKEASTDSRVGVAVWSSTDIFRDR